MTVTARAIIGFVYLVLISQASMLALAAAGFIGWSWWVIAPIVGAFLFVIVLAGVAAIAAAIVDRS